MTDAAVATEPVQARGHLFRNARGVATDILPWMPSKERNANDNQPYPIFLVPKAADRKPVERTKAAATNAKGKGRATPSVKDGMGYRSVEVKDPLGKAVMQQDLAKVKKVLEKGGPTVAESCTPLMLAAERGNEEIFKLLLEHSPVNDQEAISGETALHKAIMRGHVSIVRLLLEKGADINVVSLSGPPLEFAIGFGHEDIALTLLDCSGCDPNVKTEGKSLLSAAIEYGMPRVFASLLSRGAKVNSSPGLWSPLHSAAKYGQVEIAEELLSLGANLDALDEAGNTPLTIACKFGHHKAHEQDHSASPTAAMERARIVTALLEAGARVEVRSTDDLVAFEYAIIHGPLDVVRALHATGRVDINGKNRAGIVTPLALAAHHSSIEIVEFLCSVGANVNAVGVHGETPLMIAAALRPPVFVQRLLEAGADPAMVDLHFGRSALIHALLSESVTLETVGILANASPIDAPDKSGKDALHYAKKAKDKSIRKLMACLEKNPRERTSSIRRMDSR